MKNILILYSDGTVKSKEEHKLVADDFVLAEYFLISTENADATHYRNFAIGIPSEKLIFDEAIIEYQLGAIYTENYDNTESEAANSEYLEPVKIRTNSICDLICIINSIDRLNNLNNFMRSEDYCESLLMGVLFMSITLYRNGEVSYDKTYKRNEKKEYNEVTTVYATKKFKDLYPINIVNDLTKEKEFIFLRKKKKTMRWKQTKGVKKYSMIGIPLIESNTITFCSEYEYTRACSYQSIEIGFNIFFSSNDKIEEITEKIQNCEEYSMVTELIDEADEIYLDEYKMYSLSHTTKYVLFDLLAHANFIINMCYMLLTSLYPYSESFENEDTDDGSFDIVIGVKLISKDNDKHCKEFTMNRYSLLDTSLVLNLL